jgi:RNA polymerase sigma-70 factor, ECF subfamily
MNFHKSNRSSSLVWQTEAPTVADTNVHGPEEIALLGFSKKLLFMTECRPQLRRPLRLHDSRADSSSLSRNRLHGLGFLAPSVQKAAVVSPILARADNEPKWQAWVAQVAAGDEHALSSLYDDTSRIVYGLALRILRDPSTAEDTCLEVYLQVWRTAASFDPQRGTVLAWLVTLVRSRAIDQLRSRKARRAEMEDTIDEVVGLRDSRPSPEMASAEAMRALAIRESIADLAPEQREAIELAFYSGLSHSEIAARKDLPLGTVKTRIRTGMLHLRKQLKPYEGGL